MAYDVNNNADVFDYEISDGLNCLGFGQLDDMDEKLIFAGGNCSITGLNKSADESYWTVTGDNAKAIAFIDWDQDGVDEMVVGSDDFCIRVFKGEELVFDINEEAKIRALSQVCENIFGYCLENGKYGCYYSRKRLWHQKSKTPATVIVGMDYEIDEEMHLAIGFENGMVEVRSHRTGKLVH